MKKILDAFDFLRSPISLAASGIALFICGYWLRHVPTPDAPLNLQALLPAGPAFAALFYGAISRWRENTRLTEALECLEDAARSLGDGFLMAKTTSEWARSPESIRVHCSIMFIDDEHFKIPTLLRDDGYNVHHILQINGVDDLDKIDADIVFCDIGGVAATLYPDIEGAGVVRYLKERVSVPPIVVAYTSTRPPVGSPQSEIIHAFTDGRVEKHAQPEEYIHAASNLLYERMARRYEALAERLGVAIQGQPTRLDLLRAPPQTLPSGRWPGMRCLYSGKMSIAGRLGSTVRTHRSRGC